MGQPVLLWRGERTQEHLVGSIDKGASTCVSQTQDQTAENEEQSQTPETGQMDNGVIAVDRALILTVPGKLPLSGFVIRGNGADAQHSGCEEEPDIGLPQSASEGNQLPQNCESLGKRLRAEEYPA